MRRVPGLRLGLIAIAIVGCGAASGPGAESSPVAAAGPPPSAAPRASAIDELPRFTLGEVISFRGACDASGAAGLPGGLIAVADDEDNHLRVYDAARGGAPVQVLDTRRHLPAGHQLHREMDLEGSAAIGSRVYWIASHARKKSGKLAPSRLNLFASDVRSGSPARLAVVGRPYTRLLRDMIEAPGLRRYDLAAAADRSPIEPGGLNIEGLTDTPDGHLLIGFRNPIPGGRALLVRLTNPAEVIEGRARPRFGPSIELELEGRGVRTIAWWRGAYWIVGGAIADPTVPSRLYRWDGAGRPVWLDDIDLGDLNIEAIATVLIDDAERLLLISDDGSRRHRGRRCKKLPDPTTRQFRAVWLESAP